MPRRHRKSVTWFFFLSESFVVIVVDVVVTAAEKLLAGKVKISLISAGDNRQLINMFTTSKTMKTSPYFYKK